MNIVGIQTQLDTTVGAVSGIVSHFAQMPDSVPDAPCSIIGQPKGTTLAGGRQDTDISIPIYVLVARAPDEQRASQLLNPFVNGVIAALSAVSSASGLWNVITQIEWDTNRYLRVGGTAYHAILFTVHMEVVEAVNTYGSI